MSKIIAIDFDEVCAQNVAAQVRYVNETHGKDLHVDDIPTAYLFHAAGWGGPTSARHGGPGGKSALTLPEVARLKRGWLDRAAYEIEPVAGAADALRALHAAGWATHIVTSRTPGGRRFLEPFFARLGVPLGPGGVVEALHFTGTPGDPDKGGDDDNDRAPATPAEAAREIERDAVALQAIIAHARGGASRQAKVDAVRALGASVFVDDSPMFAAAVAQALPDVRVVQFGAHAWSDHFVDFTHVDDLWSGDERAARGLPLPFRRAPDGLPNLVRAKTWGETLEAIGVTSEAGVGTTVEA